MLDMQQSYADFGLDYGHKQTYVEEISLREVYEAIEGRLQVERCMVGKPLCNKLDCPLGDLFARLSDDVLKTLGKTTLADIELPLDD